MKYILVVCLIALATGCARKDEYSSGCKDTMTGLEQAVYNNIKYRDEIKKDFNECMKGNSNRDVVYNDTNELAKTCAKTSFSMNGGIAANSWEYSESFLAAIESDLRACGKLDDLK